MGHILWVEPVFKEMIWGGNQLKEKYGYAIPSNQTGECWAPSAHPNGDNTIKSIQSHKHYNTRPKLKISRKKYIKSLIRSLKSGRNTENIFNSNLNQPSIYFPEKSKNSSIKFCAPIHKSNSSKSSQS